MAKKEKATVKDDLVTRGNLLQIPFSKLKIVDGRNIREDLGDLKELAASIKAIGVKTPIRVKKNGEVFEVVAGHRRYAAAKLLYDAEKLNTVFPATTLVAGADETDIIFELLADLNSQGLTVLELAEAVKRLLAAKVSEKEIAEKINKGVVYVRELNRLIHADKRVLDAIRKGEVSATLVRDFLKKGNLDELIAQLGGTPSEDAAEEEAEETSEAKPKKKTKARVTKKSLGKGKENGIKNFKKFGKMKSLTFASTIKENEYYRMYRIFIGNEYSVEDIKDYFVNGKDKPEQE